MRLPLILFLMLVVSFTATAQLQQIITTSPGSTARQAYTISNENDVYINNRVDSLRDNPSGGGSVETASNGLTKVVNDIQLGGTATSSILIPTNAANLYDFHIGLGDGEDTHSFRSFRVGANSGSINFGAGFGALDYGADMSGQYTLRSATDKGYVLGAKTYTGKQTFAPSATVAGLNFGSFAGDPSTLVNGDVWYNSTSNIYRLRINGVTRTIPTGTVGGGNEIVYSSANNIVTTSAGLSFTSNTLTTPGAILSAVPTNDNTLTQMLARDATTGAIKYRSAASMAGETVTAGNGLQKVGTVFKLGKDNDALTETTTLTWRDPAFQNFTLGYTGFDGGSATMAINDGGGFFDNSITLSAADPGGVNAQGISLNSLSNYISLTAPAGARYENTGYEDAGDDNTLISKVWARSSLPYIKTDGTTNLANTAIVNVTGSNQAFRVKTDDAVNITDFSLTKEASLTNSKIRAMAMDAAQANGVRMDIGHASNSGFTGRGFDVYSFVSGAIRNRFNLSETEVSMKSNTNGITINPTNTTIAGSVALSQAPTNDDALTQILARDGTTGTIKYRTAASLGGGGSAGWTTDVQQFFTGSMEKRLANGTNLVLGTDNLSGLVLGNDGVAANDWTQLLGLDNTGLGVALSLDVNNVQGLGDGARFVDLRATPKGLQYPDATTYEDTGDDKTLITKGWANNRFAETATANTFTGKQTFTVNEHATTGHAGINIGTITTASTPANTVNGDMWITDLAFEDKLVVRMAGADRIIPTGELFGANKIVLVDGDNKVKMSADNFSFASSTLQTPNVTIANTVTLSSAPTTDNTEDLVLVRDATTGVIQGRSAATIGGGGSVTASNGLNKVGSDIQFGGLITGDITLTGDGTRALATTDGLDPAFATIDLYADNAVTVSAGGRGISLASATDARLTDAATSGNDRNIVDVGLLNSNLTLKENAFTAKLKLASDVSTAANTTPVSLTGMSFTYEANTTYEIIITGAVSSALATTGYGFGLDCSTAPTLVSLTGTSQLANTGTVSAWSAIADNAIVGVTSGTPTNATNVPVNGGGVLVTGGSTGTCTFIFRSETTAVTTAKAGTVITVVKIP